jgi:hypothetical protein
MEVKPLEEPMIYCRRFGKMAIHREDYQRNRNCIRLPGNKDPHF